MTSWHPSHPSGDMVWIAVHGSTVLGTLEAAVAKFDRWGIVHSAATERTLFINASDFDRLAGQIAQRRRGRRLFSRPRAGGVSEARRWMADHLEVDRVVITELFSQPLLRHDEGRARPLAEATLIHTP